MGRRSQRGPTQVLSPSHTFASPSLSLSLPTSSACSPMTLPVSCGCSLSRGSVLTVAIRVARDVVCTRVVVSRCVVSCPSVYSRKGSGSPPGAVFPSGHGSQLWARFNYPSLRLHPHAYTDATISHLSSCYSRQTTQTRPRHSLNSLIATSWTW